ncbi:MAG TPA: type I-U CRISPR-associated protein Csb2 [Xanthobacteraceae bacterium]|nr:type I-U CRISPR-associated protein Csb2 [Xanthobacteraceae bacterium]
MRWLCIETHFLAGRYHGRRSEREHNYFPSEWPPNPYRLFQALVAAGNIGFRRTEFSDAKKEALRWLERRAAPEIVAPPAREASVVRLYVPNNDMDKVARAWAQNKEPEKQPNELRTDKDLRPHRLAEDGPVRFLWTIAEDEWETARPHIEILCEEARHLHCLGLGIDLVAGNGRILSTEEKNALPGETWIAEADGTGWRVPVAGSLDELLARYADQKQRVQAGRGRGAERYVAPPAPPSVYREVGYIPRAQGRRRPVHAFALVDEDGSYRSFDPRHAMEVAAWLRHTAHERAKAMKLDADFIERFVCGHGENAEAKNNRFSYLPLPTIAPKGRDGRIRRVLLAEPFGGGGGKAQAVALRLAGASLIEDGTGEIKADLRAIDPYSDGVSLRYLRKARTWGSVTPLVLPGRDDFRTRKAHALVLKALAQAGYTTPVVEITLQREPVFPGAEMARAYRVPAYLKGFPRTHAIITFSEDVPGPLAIGAGRHIGLGLFAALA